VGTSSFGLTVFAILVTVNFPGHNEGATRDREVGAPLLSTAYWKADGHRCGPFGGLINDTQRRAGDGSSRRRVLLWLHGWRIKIRAWRCDRGVDNFGRQYFAG